MEHMEHFHCPVEYDKQSVHVPSYREKYPLATVYVSTIVLYVCIMHQLCVCVCVQEVTNSQ